MFKLVELMATVRIATDAMRWVLADGRLLR